VTAARQRGFLSVHTHTHTHTHTQTHTHTHTHTLANISSGVRQHTRPRLSGCQPLNYHCINLQLEAGGSLQLYNTTTNKNTHTRLSGKSMPGEVKSMIPGHTHTHTHTHTHP